MGHEVTVKKVVAQPIAAVRRQVKPGEVARAWKPALDLVWKFLRSHPGLRTDGHNVFVYRHPTKPGGLIEADFGVQVSRSFVGEGEVILSETLSGQVASTTHVGDYGRLHEAHAAIEAWRATHGRTFAGRSSEIYGDWHDDPTKVLTEVMYLLA